MVSIFRAWLPLAVSFLLMMVEGPALQGAIGRLRDPQINLAAWGLTILLSLLVESPVIMLLATSIALARDGPSYRALQTFTLRLCLGTTLLTALIAYTPLFPWIGGVLMHQPEPIIHAAQPAMQIMLLWTSAIGWRRFCQGILVRHNRTVLVSWGTLVRLTACVTCACALVAVGGMAGVQTAALAIMAGVLAECAVSTAFARPVVIREVLPSRDERHEPLTQAMIFRFHLPLAATTLLALFSGPLTSAALGRLPSPEESLAAWPVAFTIVLVIRSGCMALQEITVAHAASPDQGPVLRNFTWMLGLATSALAAWVTFSPLLGAYLNGAIHLPAPLRPMVREALLLSLPLPLITALASWCRGLLVAARRTPGVYQAMGLGLAAQALGLVLGVLVQGPSMAVGALSLILGAMVELAFLAWCCRQLKPA